MNEFNVKEIRKKMNISQEKLAEMLGVHTRTVQNWESGTAIPKAKHAKLRELTLQSTNISESPVIVTGSNNTCNGNNINSNEVVGRLIEQMKMQFEEKDKQIEEKDRQIGRLLRLLEKANGI